MSSNLIVVDLKKTNKDHLFTGKKEDVVYLKIKDTCFIFSEVGSVSCSFLMSEGNYSQDFLDQMLDKAKAFFKAKPENFKLVGPTALLSKIERRLKEKSLHVTASVYRNTEFEIYHFFENGKLRLSKEAVVNSSMQTSASVRSPRKVLIVDDSPTIRNLLTTILQSDPDLKVVATAEHPNEVEALIKLHQPHVMTLDIHMPDKDGVTLLKELFPKYKTPTIMISSISKDEGPMVFDALEHGAIDYIQKPSLKDLDQVAPYIIDRVKAAAEANLNRRALKTRQPSAPVSAGVIDHSHLILMGASTGGTEALRHVLTGLPAEIPPILIVQHIPPVFSLAFAKRLNELCPFEVKEAEDGDIVKPNRVLVAPGGFQMEVVRDGSGMKVTVKDAPPVNRHKPSVDVLFKSAIHLKHEKMLGVILTGMGADGARGLLELKNAGAYTLAQDKDSCVVFGMPKEAINMGAASKVVSLDDMSEEILNHLKVGSMKRAV